MKVYIVGNTATPTKKMWVFLKQSVKTLGVINWVVRGLRFFKILQFHLRTPSGFASLHRSHTCWINSITHLFWVKGFDSVPFLKKYTVWQPSNQKGVSQGASRPCTRMMGDLRVAQHSIFIPLTLVCPNIQAPSLQPLPPPISLKVYETHCVHTRVIRKVSITRAITLQTLMKCDKTWGKFGLSWMLP